MKPNLHSRRIATRSDNLMNRHWDARGLTASWTYDADDQLLQVRNATPADVISQYDYTYDAAGRRIEIARSGTTMSESRTDAYGYNARNELTSATRLGGPASVPATPEYAYQYDDIGNRITSTDITTNRTCTANNLNQYSAITTSDFGLQTSSFEPQFDDDGNQTLIQTSTSVWFVTYNGENRPVIWTGGTQAATTNIVVLYGRENPRDCRKAESRRLSAPCAHEGETVGKGEERTEVSVLQPQEARRGDGDAQVRVGASPREQRRYRLKYAETYYGELQKLGLVALTRRRYR